MRTGVVGEEGQVRSPRMRCLSGWPWCQGGRGFKRVPTPTNAGLCHRVACMAPAGAAGARHRAIQSGRPVRAGPRRVARRCTGGAVVPASGPRRGNATAQFNLGVLYGQGQGVPQDSSSKRNLWFTLARTACPLGLPTSRRYAIGTSRRARLTPTQLVAAQALAQTWQPPSETPTCRRARPRARPHAPYPRPAAAATASARCRTLRMEAATSGQGLGCNELGGREACAATCRLRTACSWQSQRASRPRRG